MSDYIDYESINITDNPYDIKELALNLMGGGWTSKDRDQMLEEYYGSIFQENFDFESWVSCHPGNLFLTLDELKAAAEDSIDRVIEVIRGEEDDTQESTDEDEPDDARGLDDNATEDENNAPAPAKPVEIEDGWYTICGYEVWVENGCVVRGVHTHGLKQTTTYPYRASKYGGWDSTGPIDVELFRYGVGRGIITMQ